MKPRIFSCVTVMTLFAVLALPVLLTAQEEKKEHHRFKLIDLGTLGGPAQLWLGERRWIQPVEQFRWCCLLRGHDASRSLRRVLLL